MGRSWWGRFTVLIVLTVLSALYVAPSLLGVDLEKTRLPFKQKINLGLDLQGGLYLVMGVDFIKVFRDVVDRQGSSLESSLKEKGIAYKSVKMVKEGFAEDDSRLVVEFDDAKKDTIKELLKKSFWNLRLTGDTPGKLEAGLTTEYRQDVRERTINQSIEVIRNRIDEFGVSEPVIASQGSDRIVIELPGVKEVDRAKDLIGRTAKLEFKIVADKVMAHGQVAELVGQIEKDNNLSFKEGKEGQKFSEFLKAINEKAKGKIPEGTEIAYERPKGALGEGSNIRIPYLLYAKTEVTGDLLQDAQVSFDQETRAPEVSFRMNPKGADLFGKVTSEHIHDRLAIVLDGTVVSAPVIQSKISESGRITLGRNSGDDSVKEAKDLAIVLRAGALPAQLEFLEQRITGPSLGQDSIRKGALATVIGSLLVFLFVMFYYRVSGVIATVSLILNVLFVLAILVGIEATLTLPGIAGIGLTVGIAVDSNVVIYERIREELRAGKRAAAAIEAGFQKAFRTILDANVTNAAAALVLMTYGTGPIKGFAVTLMIGIVTTLFTAIFVCKLIFAGYLKLLESREGTDEQVKISI